jgi:hypothetical protein
MADDLRRVANVLGRGAELTRAQLGREVMEAAAVVAGLCDAAEDGRLADVERALEEARGKLYEAAALLGAVELLRDR